MSQDTRFVGLDVHAETIAVAVAEASGEVRSVGCWVGRTSCGAIGVHVEKSHAGNR